MTFVQPPRAPERPVSAGRVDPWSGVPVVEPLAVRAESFSGDDVRFVATGAPYSGWWRRAAALVADGFASVTLMSFGIFAAERLVGRSSLLGSPGAEPESLLATMRTLTEFFAAGPGLAATAEGFAAWTAADFALIGAVMLGGLVVLAMQAYTGSSPGKLVLGIAVVRLDHLRPAGLARTLLRQVAHQVDDILLIGYLRPLWQHRRQTFADSLARTIVLRTRRPLGHPALQRGSREPEWMPVSNQAAHVATGRIVLTVLSVGVIALGAAAAGPVLLPIVVEVVTLAVELVSSLF